MLTYFVYLLKKINLNSTNFPLPDTTFIGSIIYFWEKD